MLQKISTAQLGWNEDTRTLFGEISDTIGIIASNMIQVTNSVGKVRIFELIKENRDRENDIVSFEFEARSDPTMKLVLFND